LICEQGEVFLLALQGKVGILPARGEGLEPSPGGAATPGCGPEFFLKPGQLYPLAPGFSIILGEVRFAVEETQEKMFMEI
jgi:hypothetical protein